MTHNFVYRPMPWDRPLARELVLSDGQKLKTLRDAARLFAGRFDSVKSAPPLQHAVELLMEAANTGTEAEVNAAMEQIASVLRLWRVMA